MAFWNRWFRPEIKAAVSAPVSGTLLQPYMPLLSAQEISPYNAWLLYQNVSTFAKIVDLIADETARLVPLVKVGGKNVVDHPLAKFMQRPGFNRTRQRFIKQLAVQYLVTGNGYMHTIGEPDRPPIALDVLKSNLVTFTPGFDMWPEQFFYSEGTRSIRFNRDPNEARDYRWIDDAGLGECTPIFDMDGNRRGVGMSRLNAIRHDVELRLQGIIHNSATLQNGARLSGILSVKDGLAPEQRDDLRNQIQSMMSGAANAGRVMVTGGGELDFTQMSMNAKDMDFANLIRLVEDAIVSRYNVPVTLFRTDAQTQNNYDTAWRQLYFTSVLPTFETIWSSIANHMSLRLGEDIEVVHDTTTNPILAKHASEQAISRFNARLISRNEARAELGYEPCLGGDTIYGPMGEIPVGEDYFTGIDEHLTADGYHGQRTGSVAPERQKPGQDEDPAKDKPKPAAKPAAGKSNAWADHLRVVH